MIYCLPQTVRKVNAMALCFNRLWKLLIDRGMTRTEMRLAAGISTSTLAKLNRGEEVNTAILVKIWELLLVTFVLQTRSAR